MAVSAKIRTWSQDLLSKAVEFHGHGGPFMVIGLRIGLLALSRLDATGWFDLNCTVRLPWRPPDSCVIDGIQTSTGCTMGKHNIEVGEAPGISAAFAKRGETVTISLRREVLQDIRSTLARNNEYETQKLVSSLVDASNEDLFEVSR